MELRMLPHAKRRLFERFGLRKMPEGKHEALRLISNNRSLRRVGNVYYLWLKDKKKVVSVFTEKIVRQKGWLNENSQQPKPAPVGL